jgi:uncharacterized protein (TIGR03435 family)
MDAQRFNIQATMPAGATEKQVPQMLQALLAERFKLVIRREAGGNGMTVKGGPMGQMHMTMADGKPHLEAAKMSMTSLAEAATAFAGRPVVDMTELKGNYQVALDLSMDHLKKLLRPRA